MDWTADGSLIDCRLADGGALESMGDLFASKGKASDFGAAGAWYSSKDTGAGLCPKRRSAKEPPAKQSQPKKKKENRFLARFQTDKKRIYDPQKGGYQAGGLREVIGEYKQLWEDMEETLRGLFDGLRYKIAVTRTEIYLDFGTGNPAYTGMAYSAVWGIVGMVYPLICRHVKMEYPYISVTPDFHETRFDLEIKSIIKVRPAHIIHAVLKQGWHVAITYLKNKKGSVKHG